jgi:fluoroquinolone transport system permease protein
MKALIDGDVRFQFKYGIYLIYLFFSLFYIGVLFAFPEEWREKAAIVMIFTDPAAMGLFFMGAIVLFEKSERVLSSIAVSPVKAWEYVLSKLFSIGIVSTVVGLAIGISVGIVTKPILFIIGVFLCSCLFSAVALTIARNISTLNQFMLATIPAEILIVIPAILWLFWYKESWLMLHPGVCMMVLCIGGGNVPAAFIFLLLWTLLFTVIACRTVNKMLKSVGGVRL